MVIQNPTFDPTLHEVLRMGDIGGSKLKRENSQMLAVLGVFSLISVYILPSCISHFLGRRYRSLTHKFCWETNP